MKCQLTTQPVAKDTRPATRVNTVRPFSSGCGRPSLFSGLCGTSEPERVSAACDMTATLRGSRVGSAGLFPRGAGRTLSAVAGHRPRAAAPSFVVRSFVVPLLVVRSFVVPLLVVPLLLGGPSRGRPAAAAWLVA